MQNNKVLYFSINAEARLLFKKFVKAFRFDERCSFRLIDTDKDFSHVSDLTFLLEKKKTLSHLTVIVDYSSFGEEKNYSLSASESVRRNWDYDAPWEAAKCIRRAILRYPEVLFLFDESGLDGYNFADNFLFMKKPQVAQDEMKEEGNIDDSSFFLPYHQFNNSNSEPFLAILNGRDNLFDGSNLRNTLKKFLYKELRCARHNFGIIQNKRYENLALCVEEESSQNRFNSYSLFANGFRVMPIVSAHELKFINEHIGSDDDYDKPLKQSKLLIIRDYDLQFSDVDKQINTDPTPVLRTTNDNNVKPTAQIIENINEIDRIRGMRFYEPGNKYIPHGYENRWLVLTSNETRPYWNNLIDDNINLKESHIPVYFISKGKKEFKIRSTSSPVIEDGKKAGDLQIKGMYKPITGIYLPFWNFKEVKEVSDEIRHAVNAKELINYKKMYPNGEPNEDESKKQVYKFITKRENHSHGIPLDVYDMSKSMLDRAEKYFEGKRYTRAAIVATEALEIMNGYHEALMLKAYHIKSISENAIAMNISGGDEERLKADTYKRVQIIHDDVRRMLFTDDSEVDRHNLEFNILNQIFSDCRNLCRDKEHFESEAVFISAIAHINEGYEIPDIINEIIEIARRCKNELISFWSLLK